jgi:antitoxin VapB
MAKTRLFKNGNSQAVRIPAELAYSSLDIDLVIERQGDELRIRPAQRRLQGVLEKLAQFREQLTNGCNRHRISLVPLTRRTPLLQWTAKKLLVVGSRLM